MMGRTKHLLKMVIVIILISHTVCLGEVSLECWGLECSPTTFQAGVAGQWMEIGFYVRNNGDETAYDPGCYVWIDTIGLGYSYWLSPTSIIPGGQWWIQYEYPTGYWEIPTDLKAGTHVVHVDLFHGKPAWEWEWEGRCSTSIEITGTIPEVVTLPATNVGQTYATLRGRIVDDGGESCQYLFLYRDLNSSIWQDTGWQGSVYTGYNFSAMISGLKPGITYEFRADARNSAGMAYTDDTDFLEFVTPEWLLNASDPNPADGTRLFETWANLSWRPGDDAILHNVYIGTNIFDMAPVSTQTETSFLIGLPGSTYPNGLVQGTTYYWRIDEVLDDNIVVEGDIWSFSVEQYLVILDEEQTLDYDNSIPPYVTELTLETPMDLTEGGIFSYLLVRFKGDPENSAEQVYVKLKDSTGAIYKVTYPDPSATRIADWIDWLIPLSAFSNVDPTKGELLIFGTGTEGKIGGTGNTTLYSAKTVPEAGSNDRGTLIVEVKKDEDDSWISGATVSMEHGEFGSEDWDKFEPTKTSDQGICTFKPKWGKDYTITVIATGYQTEIREGVRIPDTGFYSEKFYLKLTPPDIYPAKLIPYDSDYGEGDWLGRSVSISGKYAIAGAVRDNDDSGSAYIFERGPTGWTQTQQFKLTAKSPMPGDRFGGSVSISGEYAIVGAEYNDSKGSSSGAAYIFHRTDAVWEPQEMPVLFDVGMGDRFGYGVSISGNYAIIGSYSGPVHILNLESQSWENLQTSSATTGSGFGRAVSISGDYAIVGAPLDNNNGTSSGSAYIFKRSGSTWIPIPKGKLFVGDGQAGDEFGCSVCIKGDYVIIGAIKDDKQGEDAGAAYIFKRSGEGLPYELLPDNETDGGFFGNSVSIDIDTDGNYYAVVAAYLDADNGTESGSAYIFKQEGQDWELQAKLTAPSGDTYDHFGQGVSIDGSYVIVGAPLSNKNGSDSGSAYIFKRTDTTWSQ